MSCGHAKAGECRELVRAARPLLEIPFQPVHAPVIPSLRSCMCRKPSGMESKMTRTLMVLGALCGLTMLGGCASDYYERGHYQGGGVYYGGAYEPDYYPYAYGPDYSGYDRGYYG